MTPQETLASLSLPPQSEIVPNRAKWDELNRRQAALYLAAGRRLTPEQNAIVEQMKLLRPAVNGVWDW